MNLALICEIAFVPRSRAGGGGHVGGGRAEGGDREGEEAVANGEACRCAGW